MSATDGILLTATTGTYLSAMSGILLAIYSMWHIDLESVSENDSWVNIGYGRYEVLSYFCDMVDVLTSEFKMHLTPEQVLRLAECTPGLTVYQNTDVPEGEFDSDVHMRPIYARETLEKHLAWKEVEE